MAKSENSGVVAFVETPLPKSTAGRRGTPLDEQFADQLVSAFQDFTTLDVDGTVRPRALGHPQDFDTRGKASSTGKKYQDYVAAKLGNSVKLRVYSNAVNDKGEQVAPFHWQVYVPLNTGTESA